MQKELYNKIYSELSDFFKDDSDLIDALEYINDAVIHYQDELFMVNKETSNSSFPLSSSIINKKDTFAIFSDGACRGNPGPGAWGTVIQDSSEKVIATLSGIDFRTTNNQMELLGAIEGLNEIIKISETPSKKLTIYLYSDSKYLVDGMTKWLSGWKKRGWKKADRKEPENLGLWQNLDKLSSQFQKINWNWVKGHAGHPQNEYCDELANKALDDAGC